MLMNNLLTSGTKAIFLTFLFFLSYSSRMSAQSVFEAVNGFEPHFLCPQSSGIKNIKKDYGAKGDGTSDDTRAFKLWLASKERTLYIPEGIYLVSDQIRLADGMKKTTIFGERKSKTIIRLKDGADGFNDEKHPKVFIHMRAPNQHGEQNMFNYIYHLTIEIGKNNGGAIALNYHTNNTGQLKDVTVRSVEPIHNKAFRGIAFDDYWFGPGGARYIEVEGFKQGIFIGSAQNHVTLEHIRIKECDTALINNGNGCSIRKLSAVGCPTGIRNLGEGLMALNEISISASKGNIAVYNEGSMLVSSLHTSGFPKSIVSTTVSGNVNAKDVTSYTATPVLSTVPQTTSEKSLNLPVEESPEFQYPQNQSDWVVTPSSGDISGFIQQAIDKGVSTIYVTGGQINSTIHLRNNINRIMGAGVKSIVFATGVEPAFQLEDGKSPAVILELLYSSGSKTSVPNCRQASKRSFVLRHGSLSYNVAPAGYGGKVFVESNVSYPFIFKNVSAWVRDINTEKGGDQVPNIVNDGGKLWILGQKTEDYAIKLKTTNGGFTELLGATYRQNWDTEDKVFDLIESNPLFLIENATASFCFKTFRSPQAPDYKYLIREIKGKDTTQIVHASWGGCCGGNQSLFTNKRDSGKQALKAIQYQPDWKSLDSRPIPGWFANAKFGIFIHWGVYSVPAYRPVSSKMYDTYAEWYQAKVMPEGSPGFPFHVKNYGRNFTYRDFAPLFKAELFNADQWAGLFARSGARYVVLTSKHHDGFCMWATKNPYSKNWNSFDIGPKRDLLGELSNAVRSKGMKMGIYYSLMEWESTPRNHEWSGGTSGYYLPDSIIQKYRIPDPEYVNEHLLPQIKELVTKYQPSVIFSDGEWDKQDDYWKSKEFLAWLYNNAPNKDEVVVNDRWGRDTRGVHGGYFTSEYSSDTGKLGSSHAWEESRGMGQSYGFNRAENIDDYQTSDQLIHQLIEIVSKGGNLLLNIGPAADGTIPVIMQQRLVDIGNWLKVNGEAIYNTKAWMKNPKGSKEPFVFYTKGGTDLYVICTRWPAKKLQVHGVKVSKVSLLGYTGKVNSTFIGGKLIITPPVVSPASQLQHAWVFKLENAINNKQSINQQHAVAVTITHGSLK
jgi:alpha-L-fucosidase